MALYDDKGVMQADRLRELIARFQNRPEMVKALQSQLDSLLGQQPQPQYEQVYGQNIPTEPYQRRAGSAEKWAAVNPDLQQRLIARYGAENLPDYQQFLAEEQIAAQEAQQAYLNSKQSDGDPYKDNTVYANNNNYYDTNNVWSDNVVQGGGLDEADYGEGGYIEGNDVQQVDPYYNPTNPADINKAGAGPEGNYIGRRKETLAEARKRLEAEAARNGYRYDNGPSIFSTEYWDLKNAENAKNGY